MRRPGSWKKEDEFIIGVLSSKRPRDIQTGLSQRQLDVQGCNQKTARELQEHGW